MPSADELRDHGEWGIKMQVYRVKMWSAAQEKRCTLSKSCGVSLASRRRQWRNEIHSARPMRWRSSACVLSLALTMLAWPAAVTAALGGNETSVQNDRAHMR